VGHVFFFGGFFSFFWVQFFFLGANFFEIFGCGFIFIFFENEISKILNKFLFFKKIHWILTPSSSRQPKINKYIMEFFFNKKFSFHILLIAKFG
jgi:hypothetical protein